MLRQRMISRSTETVKPESNPGFVLDKSHIDDSFLVV